MWVIFKQTYIGGIGTFPKGHRQDVSPDILAHISEDHYIKSCPPWEDKVDPRGKIKGNLQRKLQNATVLRDKIAADQIDLCKQLVKIKNDAAANNSTDELLAQRQQNQIATLQTDIDINKRALIEAETVVKSAKETLGNFDTIYKTETALVEIQDKIKNLESKLNETKPAKTKADSAAAAAKKAYQPAAEAVKRSKGIFGKKAQPGDGYLIAEAPKLEKAMQTAEAEVDGLAKKLKHLEGQINVAQKQESILSKKLGKLRPAEVDSNTDGQAAQAE